MHVYDVDIIVRKDLIRKGIKNPESGKGGSPHVRSVIQVKEIACVKHRTRMCLVCCRNYKEASVAGIDRISKVERKY